jgi:hypothetical protein
MKFKLVKVAVIASVGVTLVGTAVAQGSTLIPGENLADEDGRECISATTSEEGDGGSKVYRMTISNGCDQPIFGYTHSINSNSPGGKRLEHLIVPAGGQKTRSCRTQDGCLGFTHFEVMGFMK